MFYFHKVAYVQYLGEVGIFSYVSKTFLPLYNSAKIIKIDRDFPKLWSQMYCHLFMVHSVYTKFNTLPIPALHNVTVPDITRNSSGC